VICHWFSNQKNASRDLGNLDFFLKGKNKFVIFTLLFDSAFTKLIVVQYNVNTFKVTLLAKRRLKTSMIVAF
jgi:hypothetical protein